MDLSFPGRRSATATSCIPHDSVHIHARTTCWKSENGFFHCDTCLQIFQIDSKICEAEVTVTPLISKICKPCRINVYCAKWGMMLITIIIMIMILIVIINYIEDITRWREDMNFIFKWQNKILRTSAASE